MKRKQENWLQKNKIHIIVWLLFIVYETIVLGYSLNSFGSPLTYAAHYFVIILFFYGHSNVALPWVFKNKTSSFILLPVVSFIQIVIYAFAHLVADRFLNLVGVIQEHGEIKFDYQFVLRNLYRGIYFMGFSTGYFLLRRYLTQRKRMEMLELERLQNIIDQRNMEQELSKAQNAFLKAQINPHFLFNTLDFIYHNVSSHSPIAAEAIISLSDMMRFAIDSDEMGEYIKLEQEMEQVESLLHLTRLRKGRELYLTIDFSEDVKHLKIIPLVLLTLMENIFKHGDLGNPEHMARVTVIKDNTFLILETDNLARRISNNRSNHTGLLNIEKRLIYAYGNDVKFVYHTDDQNHFKLKIQVPLDSLNYRDGRAVL
ncbi:sensor histidine kinase [Pedobacter metabolipauper]|uniref:Histidine kinase n=1 Tax=Pedobacter metabolipauper TaxID=425513 RepID=A0A4R6SST0_9SPHI|nr:sensor histidine kinase [Pedobacter metabolipauper]TDQ06478.1 histidine kinase [Pedobacter metabolipauper]